MLGGSRTLSVRLRLSLAILALFVVTLVISGVSLLMLRNAETWLETIHRDTLSEVSQALELSRNAADLATAAPFLLTVQMPFQRQSDAAALLRTIDTLETLSGADGDLALPLARMRLAIAKLLRVSAPQSTLRAQIDRVDTDLLSLQETFARRANATALPVSDRLDWSVLHQLAGQARAVARVQQIVEVGAYSRRFSETRAALESSPILTRGLAQIEAILTSQSDDLFQLKYSALTAALDAENALFRIRQLAGDINAYASARVETAQERLRLARMQTSRDLDVAQTGVALLALFSAAVAVVTALFVSGYVTRNLRLIADGMHRLASGDHSATLAYDGQTRDEIGRLFHAFGVFRANARKLDRRTAQITRQNTLFASVFRNITDGVAILSPDGVIEAENDKVNTLLRLPGGPAPAGQTMQERLAGSAFRQQGSADDRGGFVEYTNPAGDVIEVRQSQLPDGRSVWLLSETTERKRIDERLEEIRRVETLGKVTGEVAHDFGNILSTISGNLHLLETQSAAAPAHLGRIRTAVDLGISLTERLVAFARKQQLEPEIVDAGALIEGMVDLLDIALPPSVQLHLDLPEAPLNVLLDPGQMESAILNVCMNAAQAIEAEGNIWLALTAQDNEAVLSVRDDGAGMSEQTRRRAFEPFYSDRPDGAGTGLGLSMVYGFVSQSGGAMDIRSTLGAGTEITIRVPLAPGPGSATAPVLYRGAALVVDDSADIATALRASLLDLGFEVTVATSFDAAHAQLADLSELALIVSDLNLDHGRSGLTLIQSALERSPTARALLISSRLPDATPVADRYRARLATCAKPVTAQDLRSTLATLMPTPVTQ